MASITPSLAGQVWLKSIRHPFLNRPIVVKDWSELSRTARSGVHDVSGRSPRVATTDHRAAPSFVLQVATGDLMNGALDPLEEARNLDLTITAGDVFFIHVPPTRQVPGGYVVIGDSTQARAVSRGVAVTEIFTLPCTVVAPPGPDVVGTTLTWQTVWNLYGSWTALWAANPTWADLLATVGSGEDLVVL